MLRKLSLGDRKKYSIYKNGMFSQTKGRTLYKKLYDLNIIKKEFSREKPIKKHPKQLIKKELRGYIIEDKIKFVSNFSRFWFSFISANYKLIENKKYKSVLKKIEEGFEKFVSLTFEDLSNELIKKSYKPQLVETGSYWDKDIEIDILAKSSDKKIIAGESKWKNQKICKNILTKLQKKCIKAGFEPTYYALFSKSGFSKELQKSKNPNLLLYDINSFERLYDD